MIEVDVSEINTLAADIAEAGVTAGFKIVGVVEDSCRKVEEQAKSFAPRKRLPHYAGTITHDVTVGAGEIVGEVGPDADVNGQAKLAPIFEYGTAEFAPRAHMGPAFDREVPEFVRRVAAIGGGLL